MERCPPVTRIHLLRNRDRGTDSEPRCRRSKADSGPITTSDTPLKLAGELRASTTTTTSRATTTIVGAGVAKTATTTASATGRRTSGVHDFWPEHPRCEVPLALPGSDQHTEIRRGHQPQCVD
jgi:hypothetical protein